MGDFWRVDYEDKIRILRDCGVIPTEEQCEIASVFDRRQMHILAQSRLPQFLKGGEILHAFGKAKGEGVLTYTGKSGYCRSYVVA